MDGIAELRWSSLQGAVSEEIPMHDDSVTVALQPMEAKLVVVSESAIVGS
jgi:hypothetical protein